MRRGAQVVADEPGIGVIGVRQDNARTALPYVPPWSTRLPPTSRRRAAGAGVVKHTPVTTSAAHRTGGTVHAEGGEPPAHRELQGPWGDEQARRARRAGRRRCHRRERRQPRPGAGLRRPPCRRARARSSCRRARRSPRSRPATTTARRSSKAASRSTRPCSRAQLRAEEAGMEFCHPYDDLAVIAGQATLGRELIDDVADLRRVVVPLGGGGLASGVAIALKRTTRASRSSACRPRRAPRTPTSPRRRAGGHAGRRHRRQTAGRDHPPAGRALARRHRRGRRGRHRRSDGAADGAGQAVRRGRRRGRCRRAAGRAGDAGADRHDVRRAQRRQRRPRCAARA